MHNIVYGKHAVLLACKNRKEAEILRIIILEKSHISFIPKALHKKVEIVRHFPKFAKNHNGFACYLKAAGGVSVKQLKTMQRILALDCIKDVGNIGAILRSAAAFGVQAVIYTEDKMPNIAQNAHIAKASSGGVEMLKLCKVTNLSHCLKELKQENFWVLGTKANGENISTLAKKFVNERVVIVLGSEDSGIRQNVAKVCDAMASIPINPQIESLNVAIAASIIMWEMFCK